MADGPEESDAGELIRLDKLASLGPPRAEVVRQRGPVQRAAAGIGNPSALDNLPTGEVGKVRLFNAAFIVDVVLVLAMLICSGVAVALAVGTRGSAAVWLLVVLPLVLAGIVVGDITWGMCVIVTPADVIVRRHYTGRRIPINEIASAEVCERLLSFKPVVEVDLDTSACGMVRTPLVASRSLAGRSAVEQVCGGLNAALTNRRSASNGPSH